jgi:hypothetical protein
MAGEMQETSSSSVLNMVLGLEILEILLIDGAFQVKGSKTYEESELTVNAMRDAVLL